MTYGRLPESFYAELDAQLTPADERRERRYPGRATGRQPVHTVYVAADRFTPTLTRDWGAQALATLRAQLDGVDARAGRATHANLAELVGVDEDTAGAVRERVVAKLETEPIEDLRLDFEDGYRPAAATDDAEDQDARRAAEHLAVALDRGSAPPFTGLRFKSLEPATRRRGLRTIDVFLGELTARAELPAGFVLTVPKVTCVEQVEAMAIVCGGLEQAYGLGAGRLRFEVQIETPQAVLGPDGTATLARLIEAGGPRVSGLHYGTYDYSASLDIAAGYQSMEHPAADHAKAVMQLAVAGTGVRLCDGSTNILPIGDHDAVRAAWLLHARLVRRSLERGYYQGWDLHPAQLPTRFAATYAFFRSGFEAACTRISAYVEASQVGGVLDEPATAEALATFLVRALECGAVDDAEVRERTRLDRPALQALARREPQPSTGSRADPR